MSLKFNEIYNIHCFDGMEQMKDKSVTMTLTDIPYNCVSRPDNGLRKLGTDDKKKADIETFRLKLFIPEICRVTSGSVYVFCATEQVSEVRQLLIDNKMSTRLCIWEKTNPAPMNGQWMWLSGIECCVYGKFPGATFNEHCKNTVWRYPIQRGIDHPTPKPLELFKYLIRVSSNTGDTVFDPCLGSGTTAIAAREERRNYLGFELDPGYYAYAQKRLTLT